MKLIIFIFTFFYISLIASASSGIFDVLNETEYNGSLDIVSEYLEPVLDIQTSGHIRGWVDIVGFNNTVNINGTRYTNVSSPAIQYDIWDIGLYWNNNFDFITVTDIRHSVSGNNTTAEIDIHLLWHHSTLKHRTVPKMGGGSRCVPYISKNYTHEYATLHTVAQSPLRYPELNITTTNITIYDNSFNPHVDIHTPVQPFEVKTVFTYQNETIIRYTKTGYASTGAVNMSDCLYWESESDIFRYRNEKVIIDNMGVDGFNPNNLEITTFSPYESITQNNYSISAVQFDTSGGLTPKVLTYLSILLIFAIGAKKCFSEVGDII